MTGGRFNTDVVANQMYLQAFQFFDNGRASVLAVVLFVAVLPLMLINVRNIRRQGLRCMSAARPSARQRARSSAAQRLRPHDGSTAHRGLRHLLPLVPAHAGDARELVPRRRRTSRSPAGGRRCSAPSDRQWTLQNYDNVLGTENMANAFVNSAHRDHPVHRHPHHGGGLRRLRLRLDALPVPPHALPHRRRPARGAASDGAHPGAADVLSSSASRTPSWASGWRTRPSACRSAVFLLYNFISQLPEDLFETASHRRRDALPDVHAGSCCRSRCRPSRRSPSSSSCGSGTTCSWPSSSWSAQDRTWR